MISGSSESQLTAGDSALSLAAMVVMDACTPTVFVHQVETEEGQ